MNTLYRKLKIVRIDYKYCDYLRKYDSKVAFNAGNKELRPYVGILFNINNIEYFAPFSSPKEKHKKLKNTLDILKINEGKYGVVNFNNMIPVTKENYIEFDLNNNDEINNKRIILMNQQLRWLNKNKNEVYKKSLLLYSLYKNNKLPINVKERCCNYILLEKICIKYNENKND